MQTAKKRPKFSRRERFLPEEIRNFIYSIYTPIIVYAHRNNKGILSKYF